MMPSEVRFNRTGVAILCAIGLSVILLLLHSTRYAYKEEKVRLSELLSACIDLAESGGREVAKVRKMDDEQIQRLAKGRTKEGAAEYVTLGDRRSNQLITSGLLSLWPNLPYRSEEKDMELVEVTLPRTTNAEVLGMASRDEEVRPRGRNVFVRTRYILSCS